MINDDGVEGDPWAVNDPQRESLSRGSTGGGDERLPTPIKIRAVTGAEANSATAVCMLGVEPKSVSVMFTNGSACKADGGVESRPT